MTAATLFSGIGAPETAMPEWHWSWSAEIERFPSAVLASRHPHSVNLGDVTADGFTDRAAAIARPDVIVFGSPCQSFSVAGRRLGLDDPRGNLALVALGIIDRLKPRWFVFENVPGLLSSSEGSDFGLFLRTVDELGYCGAWGSLDAQWFGVAQRRERLFFVGHIGDWRYPAAVLFEPESLCGHSAPRRETGKGIAPTIASRPTGGGGLGTDFDCDGGLIAGSLGTRSAAHPSGMKHEADFMVYVAHSLNAHPGGRYDYETETLVAHSLRADGFDASEDGTGRGTPLIADPLTASFHKHHGASGGKDSLPRNHVVAFSQKDYGADLSTEITPTLRAMGHDRSHANAGGQVAIAFDCKDVTLGTAERTSALTTNGEKGHAGARQSILLNNSAVRRLTPRECERLQGFPDDYTAISYRGKPAADGPRYKALGNSMAVPVVRWILSRIEVLHD